jgi:hypothetical protein
MQVCILSAFPGPPVDPANFAFLWLRESASEDPFGQHQLTDSPSEADVILFVEYHPGHDPYLLGVRNHPVFRRFPKKSFVYHDNDNAVPVLRGVYPSIRKRDYLADRCRSAGYIARITQNEAIQYDPAPRNRTWLYSFFGEANSPVRRALLSCAHPNGLVRDTTGARLWQMQPGAAREMFTTKYAEAIRNSQFVLCPAGHGPATYRLFETMEMGRVPVVLSDDWVAPPGPPWKEFSIRIPERHANEVATILKEFSDRHENMGLRARLAWEQWFAKPVCFHRLVELCVDIQATRPRLFSAIRGWATLARAPHRRHLARHYYRSAVRKLESVIFCLIQ